MKESLAERFSPYGTATAFPGHHMISYQGTASRAHQDRFDLFVDDDTAEVILQTLDKGTLQESIDVLFRNTDGNGMYLRKVVELLEQNDDEAWAIRRVLDYIQNWRNA